MSQDEIATMDGGKCILQVRGVRPFFSEKYDITKHPRYKSHPSRGAWVEISGWTAATWSMSVAPLAGAWIELSYRGAWSVCRRRRIGARVDSNFHPAPLLFAFLFVDWYSRE